MIFYLILICFLVVYGFSTTLFSAFTMGITRDEPFYKEMGTLYLKLFDFGISMDHPPFATWFGALIPHFLNLQQMFFFRIAHVALYTLAGIFFIYYFYKNKKTFAALIFSMLFFLDPNMKATASLNVIDADLAIWMALAFFYIWRFLREKPSNEKPALPFLIGLLSGLAANSKITGLLVMFCGAIVVGLKISNPALKGRKLVARVSPGLFFAGGVILSFLIAYLFHPSQILLYKKNIGFQLVHNSFGQPGYMLGKHSEMGFWYFYLVSFFLKEPLAWLILLFIPILFSRKHLDRATALVFFAPAAIMLLVFSLGHVQIGIRYFLPGMLLLELGAAIVFDQFVQNLNQRYRQMTLAVSLALGIILLGVDFSTVAYGSYLSFFNTLAPTPSRNFTESNIDWGQGIPKHLTHRCQPTQLALDGPFSNIFESQKSIRFIAPPLLMNSNPLTKNHYVPLKEFQSQNVIAGYECFEFNNNQLFEYLWVLDHWKLHDSAPKSPESLLHAIQQSTQHFCEQPSSIKISMQTVQVGQKITVVPGQPQLLLLKRGQKAFVVDSNGTRKPMIAFDENRSPLNEVRVWISAVDHPQSFLFSSTKLDSTGYLVTRSCL